MIDGLYEKINKDSKFNVFSQISKLRKQRPFMVDDVRQYIFIHDALYEYFLFGFKN